MDHTQAIEIVNVDRDKVAQHIELCNKGEHICDLNGWCLEIASSAQTFTFGPDTILRPGEELSVYIDRGGELSFNAANALNRRGDRVLLFDAHRELRYQFVYGQSAHNLVIISDVHSDSQGGRDFSDEYVELFNMSDCRVDISGWQIRAVKGDAQFIFPEGAQLAPQAPARVYSNYIDPQTGGYSFSSPRALWRTSNESCQLLDDAGREVSCYSF
ncbi:hypothetical protein CWB99_05940 [Pseudoalteromonas rubra]|uniref:LTD domain-containing protein n=1 Tax=Pseudoalteromonas rubra TaxID=43658 RepID=A0A5S3WR97_9GAMM|nr:lamin tail domain-containing protein [Pseudoalteromonas rubra]TMP30017.1 hypothetical protein CWC00_18030 [Pseudoalteromonas rubra]TMP30597.1 hypothetical protein CWB99_05940 [Pseudoalteromonas rubra]